MTAKKAKYYTPSKDGRERIRRSYIVYRDDAAKFNYIAKQSGVLASDLFSAVMEQTIAAWESEHGAIILNAKAPTAIDLSAAVDAASRVENIQGCPRISARVAKTIAIINANGGIDIAAFRRIAASNHQPLDECVAEYIARTFGSTAKVAMVVAQHYTNK